MSARRPLTTRAKPGPFDEKRAQIAALASAPPKAAAPELRRFLADKSGYLAGEAAEIAAKLELRELSPDLAAAFRRLVEEGHEADKGCLGKRRILEALLALEAYEPEAYLAGLCYVQPEPAFGKPVDSAGPLRGLCAHALVQIDFRDAVAEVTPLLVDPEPTARAEAAHALGRSGIAAAGPVLHLKVLTGDAEPDVLQNAYRGLLRLDPRRYLPVVARALRGGEGAPTEAAALALGESRLPEALPVLRGALASAAAPAARRSLLVAIAISRSDEAIDLLVKLVTDGPEAHAAAALEALALHRHDTRVAERATSAALSRGSKKIEAALREHFR
jgi:HEAT repeat protein